MIGVVKINREELAKMLRDNRNYLFFSMSTYASDDWISGKYSRGIDSVLDAMDYLTIKSSDLMMSSHVYDGVGHPVAKHSHDFFEMMYVYNGKITHNIGKETITVYKGDCLLLAPGVSHSIEAFEADDIAFNFILYPSFLTPDFLNLISSNNLVSDFLLNAPIEESNKYLFFRCHEDPEVINTAERMLCEFLDPDVSSANMSKCLLGILFNVLLRVWKKNGSAVRPRNDLLNTDILQILQYIENKLGTASLGEAAIRFGYEKNYLSKIIKKTFGKTFLQVKHSICIDYAKALISETDIPISEIANRIGFSNMSHFYKMFRDSVGSTPAEFREKMK